MGDLSMIIYLMFGGNRRYLFTSLSPGELKPLAQATVEFSGGKISLASCLALLGPNYLTSFFIF